MKMAKRMPGATPKNPAMGIAVPIIGNGDEAESVRSLASVVLKTVNAE